VERWSGVPWGGGGLKLWYGEKCLENWKGSNCLRGPENWGKKGKSERTLSGEGQRMVTTTGHGQRKQ